MNHVSATMKAAVLAALVLVFGTPAVGYAEGRSSDAVELTMSNFRYCAAASCTPADQGYARTQNGPVPGSDNPAAVVEVPEGATVRWVYRDTGPGSCDSFDECPGHNVRLDDGSKGPSLGFAHSRSGQTAIVTTIHQPPGTLIRYYCSVNDHYRMGMTGLLRVTASERGHSSQQ